MAKDFTGFSSENLTRMLAEWGADQREREVWKDRDQSTYRYRANLLEASSQRIAALTAELEAVRRDAENTKRGAETLCRIYFEIAAEAIGEDEVRRRRDAAIDAARQQEGA